MTPWCFDVDAKIERASIVSSFTLKHAALCGDASSQGGGFGNHKMSPGATSGEFKFKFGDGGKTSHEVTVREVKAIFGKFVKEGKLTIESRDGVKMLIKGPPTECARLMKTLTTLKSQPANARDAYLKGLEPCTRCKEKCQVNMQKAEEKQRKIVEAQIAAHEMSAEKKRKREAEEVEKRASKDAAKVSEACGGVVKRVARLMPDGCVAQNGVQERSSRVHGRPPRACAGRKRGFEDARVSSALLGVS